MYFFEDFYVGKRFFTKSHTLTEEEIIAFAKQYDPQPFHVSPERAKEAPLFGGLVASGLHTMAIASRMFVDEVLNQAMTHGSPGVDELRWLKPGRPGDALHLRATVMECIPSRSRITMGIIRFEEEVLNQADEIVLTLSIVQFMGRKPHK